MRDDAVIRRVGAWLGWPDSELHRLAALASAPGPEAEAFDLPAARDLEAVASRLLVPEHALAELAEGAERARRIPEAWWLLAQLHRHTTALDGAAISPPWPAPEPSEDPLTRYFHLYVFIASVSAVLRRHAELGVDEAVTWATLEDVGLQVANYQTRTGVPGFDGAFWVWQHFRAETFRLGRLQYDRRLVEFEPPPGVGFVRGAPAAGIHIPAIGPLTPQACDDSLALARAFFARHFPSDHCRIATCTSWLLDEQLADYLPADSNIIRFQRRFTLAPPTRPGDEDVIRFVFGYLPARVEDLPRRTVLERGIVDHLLDGGSWRIRVGWLEL